MISETDDTEDSLPELVFYPSPELKLKCPGCGHKSVIKLNAPLKKSAKATCKSCNQQFMLIPNVRDNYRKPINVYGYISRTPEVSSGMKKGVHVKVIDISATGMGFEVTRAQMSRYKFAKGEPLFIAFNLPGQDENKLLNIKSEIMNVVTDPATQITKLGVKFDKLEQQIEKTIKFFLW